MGGGASNLSQSSSKYLADDAGDGDSGGGQIKGGRSDGGVKMRPLVVVLGAGYGGLRVAQRLDEDFEVLLVDRKNYFLHTIATQRAAVRPHFQDQVIIPLGRALMHGGQVVQAEVGLVTHEEVVSLDDKVKFDYLVIATGSEYAMPSKVSSSECMLEAAGANTMFARAQADILSSKIIVVVGGGPVGCELSAEIASAHPSKSVTLVHSGKHLLSSSHVGRDFGCTVLKKLRDLGVKVHLNVKVSIPGGRGEGAAETYTTKVPKLVASSGDFFDADLVFWCRGARPNGGFFSSQDSFKECVTASGRLKVDECLRVGRHKHIFAVGDIADTSDTPTAHRAIRHADCVIQSIKNVHRGEDPVHYIPSEPRMVVALGPSDGAAYLAATDPEEEAAVVGKGYATQVKSSILYTDEFWDTLRHRQPGFRHVQEGTLDPNTKSVEVKALTYQFDSAARDSGDRRRSSILTQKPEVMAEALKHMTQFRGTRLSQIAGHTKKDVAMFQKRGSVLTAHAAPEYTGAVAPGAADDPAQWSRALDPESSNSYWYHKVTRECQWEMPACVSGAGGETKSDTGNRVKKRAASLDPKVLGSVLSSQSFLDASDYSESTATEPPAIKKDGPTPDPMAKPGVRIAEPPGDMNTPPPPPPPPQPRKMAKGISRSKTAKYTGQPIGDAARREISSEARKLQEMTQRASAEIKALFKDTRTSDRGYNSDGEGGEASGDDDEPLYTPSQNFSDSGSFLMMMQSEVKGSAAKSEKTGKVIQDLKDMQGEVDKRLSENSRKVQLTANVIKIIGSRASKAQRRHKRRTTFDGGEISKSASRWLAAKDRILNTLQVEKTKAVLQKLENKLEEDANKGKDQRGGAKSTIAALLATDDA